MWTDTRVAKLLNLKFPIIQAPMAGAASPELIAAVANTGALGSLGAGYMPPAELKKAIVAIRQSTTNPFAVNLFIPEKHHTTTKEIEHMQKIIAEASSELKIPIEPVLPPYLPTFDEQLNIIIEEKIPIFSFTFGILDEKWIHRLKSHGIILIGTATNLAEALLLEQRGIDAIVAQGSEAGGHRGTFIGKAEHSLIEIRKLIPQLVHNLRIPVIAAGGIMDAHDVNTMLTLKAEAVQMGTAFLSCHESTINAAYKKALLNLTHDDTILTRAFSGKLARGLKNKFTQKMQAHTNELLGYPVQNALTKSMRKEAAKQSNIDFLSMWAGQRAYLCEDLSVNQLMATIIKNINSMQE